MTGTGETIWLGRGKSEDLGNFRPYVEEYMGMPHTRSREEFESIRENIARTRYNRNYPSNHTLHNHPDKESRLKLDNGHVIVDRDEWERTCERLKSLNSGNAITMKDFEGHVCTDLWWFSAADRKDFEEKAKMTFEEYKEKNHSATLVKVTSGVYEVISMKHLVKDDDEQQLFATIKLIERL